MTGGPGAGQLHVERSGGFAGLTQHATVPLDELSSDERAALEESFERPSEPPPGPDRFVYRFRMPGREATVQEHQVTPALLGLLDRLSDRWE